MSDSTVDSIAYFARGATKYWWLVLLRGLLAVAIGILALVWPGITLAALILVAGAFALVDGLFSGFAAFTAPKGEKSPFVIAAVAGILFGITALVWPAATLLVLTILMGAWALVRGVTEVGVGIGMPRGESTKTWMIVAGALSAVFGLLVLFWPISGIFAIAVVLGIYAILAGGFLIYASFGLRRAQKAAAVGTRADHDLTAGEA